MFAPHSAEIVLELQDSRRESHDERSDDLSCAENFDLRQACASINTVFPCIYFERKDVHNIGRDNFEKFPVSSKRISVTETPTAYNVNGVVIPTIETEIGTGTVQLWLSTCSKKLFNRIMALFYFSMLNGTAY